MKINKYELNDRLTILENLPICHAWRGYGTVIFLELGKCLSEPQLTDNAPSKGSQKTYRKNSEGETHVYLREWRIEDEHQIIGGSSDKGTEIDAALEKLVGLKIQTIKVHGNIPELCITFNNNLCINSFDCSSALEDNWYIKQSNGKYLGVEVEGFYEKSKEETRQELSEIEENIARQEEIIAERWGVPLEGNLKGFCKDCVYEVRIDGNFSLSNYSVCVNKNSMFDGKVVNRKSGCPEFVIDENE